ADIFAMASSQIGVSELPCDAPRSAVHQECLEKRRLDAPGRGTVRIRDQIGEFVEKLTCRSTRKTGGVACTDAEARVGERGCLVRGGDLLARLSCCCLRN